MTQCIVGLAAWLASSTAPISIAFGGRIDWVTLSAAAGFVGAVFALALVESRRPLAKADRLRSHLRRSGLTGAWILAFGVAAFVEEFAYRGVLTEIFAVYMPPMAAALASAGVFGLGHASQGLRGVVASAIFGLGAQGLASLSGGLLLPILAHFAYDAAVAWSGRLLALRESGRE